MSAKNLELELMNGTKVIGTFDLKRVYSLVGRTRKRLRLSRKFPFFRVEREEYVTFRYQDTYETMRDMSDSRYSVRLPLADFVAAFGVDFVPYEELRLRSAVMGRQ